MEKIIKHVIIKIRAILKHQILHENKAGYFDEETLRIDKSSPNFKLNKFLI
jgi:hypothetical protein